MKNSKQVRIRIEADYKARSLFADLMELADGDKSLLIEGMSVAFNVIKNDLTQIIPLPEKPAADPAGDKAPPALNPENLNRHTRRAIAAQTGEKIPAAAPVVVADPVAAATEDHCVEAPACDPAPDAPSVTE